MQRRVGQECLFQGITCIIDGKNYFFAWQGLFASKDGNKSIILEVITNQRFCIWHVYFKLLGGYNNLNASNMNFFILDL
jgi:hypothetical protein